MSVPRERWVPELPAELENGRPLDYGNEWDQSAFQSYLNEARNKQGVTHLSQQRSLELAIRFDPMKHPRDWLGKFRDTPERVKGLVQDGKSTRRALNRTAIDEALSRATPVASSSRDHGPKHWRDVSHMGLAQVVAGVPADPEVLVLFGAFHDTQRHNEWDDPEHGPRAADMAEDFRKEGLLDHLSEEQFGNLIEALDIHTGADGSDNTTVGAALDADRYTLWRVGIEPDFRFMSGERNHHIDTQAMQDLKDYGLTRVKGEQLDWEEILDQLDALTSAS